MSLPPEGPLPPYLRVPLGQVIRAWRMARGLTLAELAARAGPPMTRGYLSQLENDRIHTPSEEKVAQLAAALGIEPLVLLTRQFPPAGSHAEELAEQTAPTSPDQSVPPDVGPGHSTDLDLSRLLTALEPLPPARQQQYLDALAVLVEQLLGGETRD
jgi:transcriptional regulator with XRE-family HTH domain